MAKEAAPKNSTAARTAYGAAMKALKEAHRDEFADLLDIAYADQALKSPRTKRAEREAAEFIAKQLRADRKEAARLAKITQMEFELAALKGTVSGDPV